IQVSSDEEFQKQNVWDSGDVKSADSIQVEYGGKPLQSDTTYFWRVRFRDTAGAQSPWSETATFSTGLLQPSDWHAKWITGGNLLRDSIDLKRPVRHARVFIAAAGYYELHIDGARIGNHVLDPAWTDYTKRVLYSTYDVTHSLHTGVNRIQALLGRAWYAKAFRQDPKLICQIQGEYDNGKPFLFTSDENWRAFKSPVVMDDIYNGETYDARLESPADDAG